MDLLVKTTGHTSGLAAEENDIVLKELGAFTMPSPWSIKGIPQEARAAAKAAAHRQGMTLGAWIVSKIEEEAGAGADARRNADNGAPTAQDAPSGYAQGPAASPMIARSADPNAAALQAIAQIFGQNRAEMENQAVAALTARLDALAKVTEGLSNTVAHCLQAVEETKDKTQRIETLVEAAAVNADAARDEAALSLRASAAVGEKAIAALGGVAGPGEDFRNEIESAIEDRIGRIESRIAESEDEGARQVDALSDTVARTERMLEALSERLGVLNEAVDNAEARLDADSTPGAANEPWPGPQSAQASADFSADFSTGAVADEQNDALAMDDAFASASEGEILEIDAHQHDAPIEAIHAPALRERIRSRLKAGEAVDEQIQAAERSPFYTPVEDLQTSAPTSMAEPDPAQENEEAAATSRSRPSGGFGSWFSRRVEARPTEAEAEPEALERVGFAEVFPEEARRLAEQGDAGRNVGDRAGEADAPTDLAPTRREPVYDLVEEMEATSEAARRDAYSQAGYDLDQDGADEAFSEAIERARRERELLRAEVEAEVAFQGRLDQSSDESDPADGQDLPQSSAPQSSAPQSSAPQDFGGDEPLTLGPSQQVQNAAAEHAPRYDLDPLEDSNGEPAFWGELDGDAAPNAERDGASSPRSMAESVGRQSGARSVVSSQAWPFESDRAIEEAGEAALRDESGSVRYGVALTLALMGITAGAAMAALYQLGA